MDHDTWITEGNEASLTEADRIVDRLQTEWTWRVEDLRGVVNQLWDLASNLDEWMAETNYAEADQALQELPAMLNSVPAALIELALLSRIRDGVASESIAIDLPPIPELDTNELFADIDPDDEDEDDLIDDLVRDRVEAVGNHIYQCLEAAHSALEEATSAAEHGDAEAATRAYEHSLQLVAKAKDGFTLWCEVLGGHLSATGSYPGVAGEQVDSFMTWLRQQKP